MNNFAWLTFFVFIFELGIFPNLVFILLAPGEIVRKIMIAAHALGMGDGDYAFFGFEFFKNMKSFGDFTWFYPNDPHNQVTCLQAKVNRHCIKVYFVSYSCFSVGRIIQFN